MNAGTLAGMVESTRRRGDRYRECLPRLPNTNTTSVNNLPRTSASSSDRETIFFDLLKQPTPRTVKLCRARGLHPLGYPEGKIAKLDDLYPNDQWNSESFWCEGSSFGEARAAMRITQLTSEDNHFRWSTNMQIPAIGASLNHLACAEGLRYARKGLSKFTRALVILTLFYFDFEFFTATVLDEDDWVPGWGKKPGFGFDIHEVQDCRWSPGVYDQARPLTLDLRAQGDQDGRQAKVDNILRIYHQSRRQLEDAGFDIKLGEAFASTVERIATPRELSLRSLTLLERKAYGFSSRRKQMLQAS